MFLSKHDINHNVRERRTKQRLKILLQTSLPPSSTLSGSPWTEGRPWRCRPAWLASKYYPLILWFMNRKQETIHREQCCYWSLDSVHTRRLKPHSDWEVCHAILWETHTLISVCWLTNSRRPVRHLNYYGAQTWVSKGEIEIRNGTCFFFPSHVIEDDRDLVKTQYLSEAWASLTYNRCHGWNYYHWEFFIS